MADDTRDHFYSSVLMTKPESVVYRSFQTETTVLNLDTGMYHSLNPTAARMFEHLEVTGDFDASVREVVSEFDADEAMVRADMAILCDQLIERGLLEARGQGY